MLRWRSVISDVPWGSVWGLFGIFINDIDSGNECTLSQFVNDTKPSGVVDMAEGWDAIQRDLQTLKKWPHVKLSRFNKAEHKVLTWVRTTPGINAGWEMKGLGIALLKTLSVMNQMMPCVLCKASRVTMNTPEDMSISMSTMNRRRNKGVKCSNGDFGWTLGKLEQIAQRMSLQN
ncbi:rna-directed dna polymerase from mobile element jockey-like [Limosa lapponica baueri]|uniref:Rna-directed dna polymerase from mobile element jockey-like n=1 Tax=Limosa lapponica baueri TaxID=1758121 RepID=A0A2I0TX21_LIMLA|nr:rna-directed dna polymerase from mobile element jockey-like [Limosa lapponica baueri]